MVGACHSYNDLLEASVAADPEKADFNVRAKEFWAKNAANIIRIWKEVCKRWKLDWRMLVVADRASENIKAFGVNFVPCIVHAFNNAMKAAHKYATEKETDNLALTAKTCAEIGK